MRAVKETMGILLICGSLAAGQGQSVPQLSRHAVAIRQIIGGLTAQAHISVIQIDGSEDFGDYVSRDEGTFIFYDIDKKTNVILRYEAVKKIRNGYGGYNSVQHRHVDRHKELIIIAVVFGVLGALIGAAATAK